MAIFHYCKIIIACLLLVSCNYSEKINTKPGAISGWPQVPEPNLNSYSLAKYKLGEKLFFESLLSKHNNLSCASCHIPEKAFSDNEVISAGAENEHIGFRNTPSILNRAYLPHLMMEGGIKSLEHFSVAPLQEPNEMGQNLLASVQKIEKDSSYIRLFKEAYDTVPSIKYIARALAVYQRYLLSKGSAYDAFLAGNTAKLNASEKRGMQLFFSNKTNCSVCHSGFLFSDFKFHNTGLIISEKDMGRMRLTGNKEDSLAFKTPSLRNVGITFPYLHDGSIQSLDEVLEIYNNGGVSIPRKSILIKPLGLNKEELLDLKAFLLTLNDSIQYQMP